MPSSPFVPTTRKAQVPTATQDHQTGEHAESTYSTFPSTIPGVEKPNTSSSTELAVLKNLISLRKAEDQRWTEKAIPSASDEEPEHADRRGELSTKELAKELGRSEKAGLGFENSHEDDSSYLQAGTKEALLKQPRREQQQLRRDILGSRKARSLGSNHKTKSLASSNRRLVQDGDEDDEEVGRSDAVGKESRVKRRRGEYAIAHKAQTSTSASKSGDDRSSLKDLGKEHGTNADESIDHRESVDQMTTAAQATHSQRARRGTTSYLDLLLAERTEKRGRKRMKKRNADES